MCGFCTETAVFRELLGEAQGDSFYPRDKFLYAIRLQEAPSWPAELRSWEAADHIRGAVVALCRRWSDRLSGRRAPRLSAVLASDALASLASFLATLDYPADWRWVLTLDGDPPDPLPLNAAKAELDAYLEGCTGHRKPDGTEWDDVALHHRFFRVSAAFDIVANQAPDDARLVALATSPVLRAPSFDALDLWLQRRALRVCVERSGISFLKTHLGSLRLEALCAVVQCGILDEGELLELRPAMEGLTSDSGHLESTEVLELLDLKASESGDHDD